MPVAKCLLAERGGKIAVERHHHFGDAALGRRDAAVLGLQPKLTAKRGLDVVTVQQFAFYLGGFQRLGGHYVDGDCCAVRLAEVLDRPDDDAGLLQKVGL